MTRSSRRRLLHHEISKPFFIMENRLYSISMTTFRTIAMLFLSNCFMTAAWYGHLRFKSAPLWLAILASWGLAFFEYTLQVPANRWGYGALSAYQLKIIQ